MKRSDEKISYESIEKKKIIFQFFLVSISSFIAGMLFVNFTSDEFLLQVAQNIESKSNISDVFLDLVLKNSFSDIFIIFTLYVFSFSFINYLVSDIALTFLGFRTGLHVYAYFLSDIGYLHLFTVIFIKIALLSVIILFACNLAIKTLRLIKYRSNGRVRIDKSCLLSITVLTVSTVGATLVLNAIDLLI